MKRARYVIILISVIVISLYIRQISQRDIGGTKEFMSIEQKKQTYSDDISNGFIATPPIIFDSDTMENLSNFRIEAKKLINEFPTTFFTCSNTTHKKVALTFDDGPDTQTTPKILEVLHDYDIPATFFVMGENVEKHRDICRQIVSSGHQIANHSFTHLRPTDVSVKTLIDDFEQCNILLKELINKDIEYIRPPYGLVTPNQLLVLREKNLKIIGWSVDSMDWHTSDKNDIIECVLDGIHPGAIVLMHSAGGSDNRKPTLHALPTIIESLKEQGYTFVTVEELLDE